MNTNNNFSNEQISFNISSLIEISDTNTGEIVRQTTNAVHPQNMARVIARALAHEDNHYIYRMAFGNGGTTVDASRLITYYPPRDGQTPDTSTYNSRMYNETYSEIIDDQSHLIGSGPGTVPSNDPPCIPYVSGPGCRSYEHGVVSKVYCECVLNSQEPTSQYLTDMLGTPGYPESDFTFDEISLVTSGLPLIATAGYHDVNVDVKYATSNSGLLPSVQYTFNIAVDGRPLTNIEFTAPTIGTGDGGNITYNDVITTLNPILSSYGCYASISDGSTLTYGNLRFNSMTSGIGSSIVVSKHSSSSSLSLFDGLAGFVGMMQPSQGKNAGVQNAPNDSASEAERILTHAVFAPITKAANRSYTIKYTLTISVARSKSPALTNS